MFRLRGSFAGVELSLPLIGGLNSIGSGPSNRLILDQDGVSRHHAIVIVEARRILVTDQESKNGTFVNTKRIRQADADVGDVIGFGPVELRIEEIDPDDARLAVEIPAGDRDPARASSDSKDSTASHRLPDHRLDRWLVLIRHFLEQLTADPRGSAGPALAGLATEISAVGVCLVEAGDAHEPVVLAAAGEIEASSLDQLVSSWRSRQKPSPDREPDRGLFFTDPDATSFVLEDLRGLLGLVIYGDFPNRERSQQFLHVLISFYRHLRPEPLQGLEAATPDELPELQFPANYVRGASKAMTKLEAQMRPLIQGDLPVLITGETGVGKELLAEALHRSSPRRAKAFVPINCAAIPADLLEAELFGIGERVATGVAGRRGKFQEAQGGTLFLDEIGEMPAELQAKLLRVLQEKRIDPVGSSSVAIDVRLLAATNADISEFMSQGRFRRDLFFRIAGSTLEIPPLRHRREDIPLLVESFLRRFSTDIGKSIRGITVRALQGLVEHDWPGNVRELAHEVHRLIYLCPPGQAIESRMLADSNLPQTAGQETHAAVYAPGAVDAGAAGAAAGDSNPSVTDWPNLDLETFERDLIREAVRRADGNQVQAAKLLGISRHALRRRMDRFRLS